MKQLPERTRQMRDLYVKERLTFQEIGDIFGMTRERARQILAPLNLKMHYGRRKHEELEERLRASHARVIAGQSTVAEEAERLGYSSSNSLRSAFIRFGLKMGKPAPVEHGTLHRYGRYGCRCEPCRMAARDEHRKRCERGPKKHGTASGYRNYGCRCVPCRIAERHYQRELQARARQRREPVT